jgi:hypothetical protein
MVFSAGLLISLESGRTFDFFGKPSADKYKGGCIFVDHRGSGSVFALKNDMHLTMA